MATAKLYKYLDANGGLMMLYNSNLQFTNATRLNDPYDCHPSLIDFSNAKIEWMKEVRHNRHDNLRNDAWVCSLSKAHDSLLMWSYYGSHTGVCIGLDMEKVNKYLANILCSNFIGAIEMEVQYRDILEKPDYFRDFRDYFRYQLSTKAKVWEHEKEVRLLLINPINGITPMALPYTPKDENEVIDWKEVRAYPHLGGDCFDTLYLGIKIDKENKEKLIQVARTCNPNIKIYQMNVDPDAFRFKEELIN